MTRHWAVAITCVALIAGACGSGEERAVPSRVSRSPSERANVAPKPASVARKVVDRGVNVVWSTPADGAPVAVAADARGVVVTVDHERVGALDLDGSVLWATELDDVVGAMPLLMDDRVVVPFTRANGSGGCLALDRETGEMRWRYEAIITGGVAVARAGTLVLCLMRNGQTAGIAPEWGSPLWEFTFLEGVDPWAIDVPVGTPIAVDESTGTFAFVARIGGLWALSVRSVETGYVEFHYDLDSSAAPSAPAVIGDGYFGVASGSALHGVSVGSREAELVPIPVADGFDPAGVPLNTKGLVIVVGRGEITAIDRASAKPRWTAPLVAGLRGVHPVVLGETLLIHTWAGELVAFRLADGKPIPFPVDPGRAIAMLFSGGPDVTLAVGQDGEHGWIERWEAKPVR